MANPTMTLIASQTIGSGGASTFNFTSIPNTYTDLKIELSARTSATDGSSGQSAAITFNGSSSNYNLIYLLGIGAGVYNGTATNAWMYVCPSNWTGNTFSNSTCYIPNYASSNYKSMSIESTDENNGSNTYLDIVAALWSNTAAINQITLTAGGGNFVQYSTAYLYGIKNS